MKNLRTFESFINERTAKAVGKYDTPDYNELMDLLDMAINYAKENLRVGKNFKLYYNDDYIMFDNVGGASVGYDKRDIRKKDIFPGKKEVVHTFKKANYNPEETKKEVEKRSNGRISVEMSKWQGEVQGVNYMFK
jgi:hypothetical protein